MFRYYFDGAGKAVRPVIAVCLGKAALKTTGVASNPEVRDTTRIHVILRMERK